MYIIIHKPNIIYNFASQHLNTSTPQHLNTYNIMYNTENKQKGRFAPSPTGRMHLGNVFSALLSWLSIKAQGGDWVLRIEDIDPQRSRMEYADLIMSDLEWLGLTWDEGPFYQSERGEIYEAELQKLTLRGLTYPCYCTRADILATQAPHESDNKTGKVSAGLIDADKVVAEGIQAKNLEATNLNVTGNSKFGIWEIRKDDTFGEMIQARGDLQLPSGHTAQGSGVQYMPLYIRGGLANANYFRVGVSCTEFSYSYNGRDFCKIP